MSSDSCVICGRCDRLQAVGKFGSTWCLDCISADAKRLSAGSSISDLAKRLLSWEPLITSNYPVPGMVHTLHEAARHIEALEADVDALKKEVENSDAEAKAEAQKLRLDYELAKALSEAALKRAVEAEVGAEKLRRALNEIAQTADEITPWCRTIALEALKEDSE